MKKFFQIAVLGALLMAPACGMAQETHVDVHVGANLSGFVGGNDSQVQDKKVRVGSEFGVGLSYETKNYLSSSSFSSLPRTPETEATIHTVAIIATETPIIGPINNKNIYNHLLSCFSKYNKILQVL